MSLEEDGATSRRRIHLREISGDSDAPLDTVGQDLRAARQRRGDDLATVSRSLKIRKDHLDAVEEDNLAALPGKTYAIGFVRSYAGYLGLDVTKTVERYKQEISGRHDEHHQPSESGFHVEESRRLPYGWRIVAGIVVLALGYGVWHLISKGPTAQPIPAPPSLTPPRPQVVAVTKPVTPPPVTNGGTAVPPPADAGTPSPAPQSQTPSPTGQSASNATPSGTLSPSGVSDVPTARAEPSAAVPAVPPAVTGSGQVYGKLNANPRVVLRARGDTKLTVRGADGTLYLNKELKAGDSYQVPNIPGLVMATSDAGAVDVVLDGLDKGRAGENQQVLGRVSLDTQSLVERFDSH